MKLSIQHEGRIITSRHIHLKSKSISMSKPILVLVSICLAVILHWETILDVLNQNKEVKQ